MKRQALLVALALTAVAGCTARKVPVTIANDLGAWDITELYIDPAGPP